MRELEIKLTPQGVISGRVTNQAGEPVVGVQVSTVISDYQLGKRQILTSFGVQTAADGTFRIAEVPPGKYYLSASARGLFDLGAGVTAGAAPREANVRTFFPNVTDLARATALEIEAGKEMRGVDIQMVSSRVFSVRGKGSTADGGPIVDQIFSLIPKDRSGFSVQTATTATPARDGTFEFRSVAPGTYLALAGLTRVGNNYASPTLFGQQEITVADSDVEGLSLALGTGIAVTGTVTVENSNVRARPTIQLSEVAGSATTFGTVSQFRDDGTFEMRGTAPGKYVLGVFNMPPGVYLKSAQASGQDLIHTPLELTSPARLALVFSTRVGRLDGTVKDATGKPAGNVLVSLWPRTPEPGMTNGNAKFTSAGPQGTFEFADLAPGNYFIAAWQDVAVGLIRSTEFPDQFRTEAAQVTVAEDGRVTVDAPLIPRKKIEEAVAKLP